MNWITRCPACGTTYKVVPDQLKMAQGWLRCGQCHHAFDSTGLVLAWSAPSAVAAGTALTPSSDERVDIDALLKQEDRSPQAAPQITKAEAGAEVTAVAAFEQALSTFQAQPFPSVQSEGTNEDATQSQVAVSGASDAAKAAQMAQHSPRRLLSRIGLLVLSLTLALQWLWIERHGLAAATPVAAKGIDATCHLIGCVMSPLPVRDGVLIESSSLTPHEGGLLLSWSVYNATSQTVPMPALELTLLDAQDKALVRRVLGVAEQGAPSALTPGEIWDGQRHIVAEDGLSPSGYRLLSFYP